MHRLVIALVTLIGLTGAAVVAGYLFLFSASVDRAATIVPANTAVYVNVYLQPSTGQQMNLSNLIGRLPGFADEASLDEKVDQIVQNLLSGSGIDYRADVKPWLGDQVALAAWPTGADAAESQAVVIAEVKDDDAARASVADLFAEDEASFTTETYSGVELTVGEASSYAFVDEMLVIADAPDPVRAVIDTDGGADALSENEAFRARMDALPADHLASIFVDAAAIAETSGVDASLADFGPASAVLVAETDGLRLSGSAPRTEPAASGAPAASNVARGDEPSVLSEWMPPDTLAELAVFGLRDTLEAAEGAVGSAPGGEDVTSALDTIRAIAAFGFGIDLDADLLPLLDREVAISISGFDGDLPSGQLLLRPSDPESAGASLDRIAGTLAAVGGGSEEREVAGTTITTLTIPELGEVAYAAAGEVIVLGLSADDVAAAIEAHESGNSLAASDGYARTFDLAGARGGTELYVDVGALVELLGDEAALPADARDILLQVGGLGITAPARDNEIEFHAVLTIDER